MITTGTFTLEAKKEARRDGAAPIELSLHLSHVHERDALRGLQDELLHRLAACPVGAERFRQVPASTTWTPRRVRISSA